MQTIPFTRLKETLYHEKLANGLNVYILPKPGFHKIYATFSTRYGSIDNHFQVEGKAEAAVPDGIAHFLEHKMFEEPTGDIFATFASQGASANAFTSFDRTVYLFSATEQVKENLTTLINFVQNPYFTEQNVEKEKGIIGQEINMYRDNPDWRVYFGLIEALYQKHPVRIDIAGTVESISHITKDTLYECYHTFYHPSNMSLFVVGGVDVEEIMQLVRDNQAAKTFPPQGEIRRFFEREPDPVHEAKKVIELPVSLPKCLFGFKEQIQSGGGSEGLKREVTSKLVLDALLSPSSKLYQQLYDDGLISDQFGHEYNTNSNYAFSIIGGDTKDPDELVRRVSEALEKAKTEGIDAESFERSKRKKIGGFMRMMNSPEAMANEFTKYEFRDANLFDVLDAYEAVTLEEANRRLREHADFDRFAISIVRSPVTA
ncbi:EF-P 5-aminopentanol modification-associated protein YfmH [Paenibacillus ginsengarvi]|uniref:Insulinase family protein n=1 Tax=Paenibacillus ginsengarvi TaxID=400777 RepID=A0A3B0CTL9_9BACL|nr:pitrilysin family protein [Paenibacillus ginsengarvi]RKN86459.1 insulinase family protein [Paenibacillus ginsengarvi]